MGIWDRLKGRRPTTKRRDLGLLEDKHAFLLFGVKDDANVLQDDVDFMMANSSLGDIRGQPVVARIFSRTEFEKVASIAQDDIYPLDIRCHSDLSMTDFLLLGKYQFVGIYFAHENLSTKPQQFNVFDLWHGRRTSTSPFMCLMGFHDFSVHSQSEVEAPRK